MSSIDSRIVQMQFENSQFEKGVNESLKSLERLKSGLALDKSAKSLESLQRAGDSFSLAKMADSVDAVSERFSVLGIIGKRILENLTDSAYAMAAKFVKSVSIDQISAGFEKYAQKTKAVQQIVNSTGLSIAEVSEQLEKLNWFTDETSYSFTDMVSNIGKFTSMNIPLDKSVTAMQGISTWAALSGAGVNEASRAMYNLSQAIGLGSVKMQDWKSIALANMATAEFKQTAIDTAIAMGKLKKGTVNLNNFESTLSKGWFTSDVLIAVLEKYGQFATEAYELASKEGISAAEAMDRLSDGTQSLGERAFRAAQEAKTFGEAIESVKDAVSSNWMNVFENIFGNYEEAKKLWTDLANGLWDVFAAPLSDVNDVFSEWKDLGGREKALEGIYDIFSALYGIILAVKQALADVFPPVTVEQLMAASEAIAQFGANFKETFVWAENTYTGLRTKIEDVTEAAEELSASFNLGDKGNEVKELQQKLIDLGYDVGKTGADGIYGKNTKAAFEKYKRDIAGLQKELKRGDRGDDVKKLQKQLIEAGYLEDEAQADGIFGPKTEAALKEWQEAQGILATGIFDPDTQKKMFGEKGGLLGQFEKYTETYTNLGDNLTRLQRIARGVFSVFSILGTIFGFVGRVVGHVATLLAPLGDALIDIGAAFGDALYSFSNWLKESGKLDEIFGKIQKFLEPFGNWVKKASHSLLNFFGLGDKASKNNKGLMTFQKLWTNISDSIKKTGAIDKLKGSFAKLKESVSKVTPAIKGYWDKIKQFLGEKFSSFITNLPNWIGTGIGYLGRAFSTVIDWISNLIEKIPSAATKVRDFFKALFTPDQETGGAKSNGILSKIRSHIQSIFDYLFGEADLKNGKRAGLFKRIGKLLAGDVEGFTEGLTEEERQKALERIEAIRTFLEMCKEKVISIADGIRVLFTGDASESNLSDETVEKILAFRDGAIKVINTVKDTINKIYDGLRVLITGDASESNLSEENIAKILTFRDTIIGVFDTIKGALDDIKSFVEGIFNGDIKFDSVWDFLQSVWDGIKNFFGKIGNTISNNYSGVVDGISGFFEEFWNIAKNAGKWVVVGALLLILLKHLYNVYKTVKNLNNIIKYFGGTLKKSNTQPISKSILQFALSIALIAGSIWLIGQLNTDQLKQGAIAIGVITGVLILLALLGSVFLKGDKAKTIERFGKAMFKFSLAIAILAGVAVVLSIIPFGLFLNGLVKLGAILLVMGLFIGLLNGLGANSMKLQGLIGVSVAIGILALIAVLLGKTNFAKMMQGLIGVGIIMGLLVAFAGMLSLFKKLRVSSSVALVGITIAIAALSAIAIVLGRIDPDSLTRGLIGLGTIMTLLIVFAGLLSIFKIRGANIVGLIAMTIAIGALAGIAFILGLMDLDSLTRGLVSLAAIMALLLVFAGLISLFKINPLASLGLIVIAGAIGILAGIVYLLSTMDSNSLTRGIAALGAIMGLMAAMTIIVGLFSWSMSLGSALTLLALAGILVAFSYAINNLEDVDTDKMLSFTGALSELLLSLGVFSLMAGIGGISSFIGILGTFAALGIIIAAASALSKIPGFQEFMEGGATSIGKIVGKIVEEIKAAEFKGLAKGIESLNGIDTTIDQESLDNVLDIANQFSSFVSNVPEYPSIEKLIPWAKTDTQMLSLDMTAFATGITNFATGINAFAGMGFDYLAFAAAMTLTNEFAAFNTALPDYPDINKLLPWVETKIDLTMDDMQTFANGIVAFAEGLSNFNTLSFNYAGFFIAMTLTKEFAAFNEGLPDYPDTIKLIPWAKTKIDLTMDDMQTFANGIVAFAEGLSNFNTLSFNFAGFFIGMMLTNEFATFNEGLPDYPDTLKLIPWAKSKLELTTEDMTTFANGIKAFAEGLSGFDALSFNFAGFFIGMMLTNEFAAFNAGLPDYPDTLKLIPWAKSKLELTTKDMQTFADGIKAFAEGLSGFDALSFNFAGFFIGMMLTNEFATFNEGLPDYPDTLKLIPWAKSKMKLTMNDMKTFANGITNFAKGLSNFDTLSFNYAGFMIGIALTKEFASFNAGLPDYPDTLKLIPWAKSKMKLTMNDMKTFANGITNFAKGLSNFDTLSFNYAGFMIAIALTKEFASFNTLLPDYPAGDKWLSWITKSKTELTMDDMTDFADGINNFAKGLKKVPLNSSLEKKTSSAIKIAGCVATFLTTLNSDAYNIENNKSALQSWFSSDTVQGTVFDSLVTLSESIGTAAGAFQDISTTGVAQNVTAAIELARIMAEFLNFIGTDGNYQAITGSEDPFYKIRGLLIGPDGLTSILGVFSDELVGKVGNFDALDTAARALSSINGFIEILSGQGENPISVDNFLGDLDASTVVEKLTTFTGTLSESLGSSTETITGMASSFNDAGSVLSSAISSGMGSGELDTSGLTSAISGAAQTIKTSGYGEFVTAGKYLDQGLEKGIRDYKFFAVNAATFMAREVVNKVKAVFNQASPSKVFAEIGRYNDEGLAKGMTDYSGVVSKAAVGVGKSTIETAKGTLSSLSSILAEDIDDTPVVRPVVDLTDAREAASSIGGMFGNQTFAVGTTNLASRAMASRINKNAANQNGSGSAGGSAKSVDNSTNSAINFSGSNFYIRSDNDIYSLANELAVISKQEQRAYGAAT